VKQIAQYQDGRLELQEVPKPTAPPGGILVRTTHSVISIGTEKMKVEQAKMNLLQKARARPDQVRKVLETARNLGWRNAFEKVKNRLETPTPLGYSAAGIVEAVHPENTRFRVGDNVAVAGAECAFHAEYLAIPDMLAAPVPSGVPNWEAAYTTLCAIALQALRQTEPQLGDRILVMGQGLVGLLVTNLLQVNGVRVMAVDLQSSRKPFALAMGAEKVVIPGESNLMDEVRLWTDGYGVDAAIICTATQSNAPIEQAAEALRDRGKMVDVGITKIELPWKAFYEKELDVRFSRSYGPGRYDAVYEWGGVDYPIGYVRWTEQRNLQACLQLMARKQLRLDQITTRTIPFADAQSAYSALLQDASKEIGIVLEYGQPSEKITLTSVGRKSAGAEATGFSNSKPVAELHVIGAGNFARTMLLPHLKGKVALGSVINQTALSANHVKTKFGFREAATDSESLLQSSNFRGNAVIIATRHHLHSRLVQSALKSDAHVFVEKPLCLTLEELREIDAVAAKTNGSVQVGFNRRFAPATVELKKWLRKSAGPKAAAFHVFAGKLDPQHWYANFAESGGRILGEACHFLDYFCAIFESAPKRVFAQPVWPVSGRLPFPDSFTAQVEFVDGSSGQLIYTAEGDSAFPKESLRVYGAGLVAELTNYQKLEIYSGRKRHESSHAGKGHAEQMNAWSDFLLAKGPHPFAYQQARQSMLLTFAVLASIQEGRSIDFEEFASAASQPSSASGA
jgi:predicted dehydrogenase/threonine dehydrogenase-like Zn-dependent dehydrogenase